MKKLAILLLLSLPSLLAAQEALKLNDKEYFHREGLDVTFFSDYYPEGHQSGVTIIQHGVQGSSQWRSASGALSRQWSPVPKWGTRVE